MMFACLSVLQILSLANYLSFLAHPSPPTEETQALPCPDLTARMAHFAWLVSARPCPLTPILSSVCMS